MDFLVYVDGIMVTGDNIEHKVLKNKLAQNFEIKDLGVHSNTSWE